MQWPRVFAAGLGLLSAAYPLLAFAVLRWDLLGWQPWGPLLVLLALGLPMALVAVWLAGRVSRGRAPTFRLGASATVLLVLALALWQLSPQLQQHYRWIILLQDQAFFLIFAACFGLSLRAGHEPLCTFFASLVHRAMPEVLLRYTRALTWVWFLFFIVTGGISLLLFLFAGSVAWAFFANILMPVLVLAFLVVENFCRRFFLPPEERLGLRETIRSIRAGGVRVPRAGEASVAPAPPLGSRASS